MQHIRRLLLRFYGPVAASPLLFAVVALCCAAAPLSALVLGGERNLRFLLYALLQGSVWGWLACLLAGGGAARRASVAAVFLLAALVECVHYALLDHCVDADSLRLVLNTDAAEARGFFRQFFTPASWAAVAAAVCAAVAVAVAVARSRLRLPGRSPLVAGMLLAAVVCGVAGIGRMLTVLGCRDYGQLVVWGSQGSTNPDLCYGRRSAYTDPLCKAVCLGRTVSLERGNFERWSRTQRRFRAVPALACDTTGAASDSLHMVVVIGESFIRSHSSLYGYHLPVNPRLEREREAGALTVFADAVSPANFTVLSLANVLNLNSVAAGENWWDGAYFPMLFARAGWDVELFTNQYGADSRTDLGAMLFDPLMTDSVYTRHNVRTEVYDGPFVAALADSLHLGLPSARRTLTLWHLRGQHFPPADRIPPSARRRFGAADVPSDKPWLTPERRAVVADYANATLYNDSVVARIIDLYRSRPAMLVYFSDHGEEMWDAAPFGNRNRQRPDDAAWMRRQHDVPLLVWLSGPLRRRRPELDSLVRAAAGRPLTLDHIGHTLLSAGGVATPLYRPDLDVLSPSYRPAPRVTAQGYAYPD